MLTRELVQAQHIAQITERLRSRGVWGGGADFGRLIAGDEGRAGRGAEEHVV